MKLISFRVILQRVIISEHVVSGLSTRESGRGQPQWLLRLPRVKQSDYAETTTHTRCFSIPLNPFEI